MNLNAINWLAVLVCILANLIIGGLWFGGGKKAFFPAWIKAMGKPEGEPLGKGLSPVVLWPLTIISLTFEAVLMAVIVQGMGNLIAGGPSFGSGILTGFIFWLGFVAPSSLINKLFAGQLKAWIIETGNHLLDFLVMGAILGVWR